MLTSGNYQVDYYQLVKDTEKIYKELTILLVLEGKMAAKVAGVTYELSEGELLVMNVGALANFTNQTKKESAYLEVAINSLFFATQFASFFYTVFECTPNQKEHGKMNAITMLKKQVAELCLLDFSDDESKQLKITLAVCQIILLLTQHFKKEQVESRSFSDNQKIREILQYIQGHYQENLSLSEVADRFFMSTSSLSKFFKKETGEYFSDYIRQTCVKQSITELLYTKKSIEQIALDNGFSNSKTYRQYFKKIFNESPTEYRGKHLEKKVQSKAVPNHKKIQPLQSKAILLALYNYAQVPSEERRTTELSSKHKKLFIGMEKHGNQRTTKEIIINIGHLSSLTSQRVQAEILALKEKGMVTHLGVQSLFSKVPLSFKIHQEAQMNSFPPFYELDEALAFIQKNQLSLFFQVSLAQFMKREASIQAMYVEFFRHLYNHFGQMMMENWKVSFAFDEKQIEVEYAVFQKVIAVFKELTPAIEIGAALPIQDPYFEKEGNPQNSQDFFYQKIAPQVRFFSFTAEPNYVFQQEDKTFPDLNDYQHYVLNKTIRIKHLLKEYGLNRPLYLTEWNTLTGKTRNMNGTFFRGAIIIKDILALDKLVAGYGFWLNIELYENYTPKRTIKNDGLELMHFNSSKRPAYFSLALAIRVQGKILSEGEDYLLTYCNDHYQLLLWNTNYFDPHLSSEESFLKSQAVTLAIEIPKIKEQDYQIKQIDFDRHNGALFYSYDKFRNAAFLDNELQNYVTQMTHPKIKAFDTRIEKGFEYFVSLDTNGVVLLELIPYGQPWAEITD